MRIKLTSEKESGAKVGFLAVDVWRSTTFPFIAGGIPSGMQTVNSVVRELVKRH